ncbi:MAG: membrane protein [Candidatus Poribacteria bacterium]|nr:MAG: membrane protein [Candidatus Poribacteria bacterium]
MAEWITPRNVLIVVVLGVLLYNAVRVLREYERAVVFRLGRFVGVRGPGLVLLLPFVDRIVRVDLRIHSDDIRPQDVITKDNVSVTVNAVVYRRIVDPERAVLGVEDVHFATAQAAQTALRSALGRVDLTTLLSRQEEVVANLQAVLSAQVREWGVEVLSVQMKDVQLPDSMKRALARRAEAERERRAKIIHAQGERAAAEKLVASAELISQEPIALQLRYPPEYRRGGHRK